MFGVYRFLPEGHFQINPVTLEWHASAEDILEDPDCCNDYSQVIGRILFLHAHCVVATKFLPVNNVPGAPFPAVLQSTFGPPGCEAHTVQLKGLQCKRTSGVTFVNFNILLYAAPFKTFSPDSRVRAIIASFFCRGLLAQWSSVSVALEMAGGKTPVAGTCLRAGLPCIKRCVKSSVD